MPVPSPPQELRVPQMTFLGEQNGVPESGLKSQLFAYFHSIALVGRAYLARVKYGEPGDSHVAICVRTDSPSTSALGNKIGDIFSEMFRREEHLDVIFVNCDQEAALSHVCRPFYEST